MNRAENAIRGPAVATGETRPDSSLSPEAVRAVIRAGRYSGATSGLAPGYVQGNLVILPKDVAGDFLAFAQQNPKPCPVIGMSETGSARVPALGVSIDLRTDLPRYRVWKHGALVAEVPDILSFWRDDLVSFVIGCSFSFEEALIEDGIPLRHVSCGSNVAMYRTNIACAPAGPFAGPMVVSMRPLKPADAIRAIQITSRFPAVHGVPVHIGMPAQIGIKDLAKPDYGDPVEVKNDELPVFWACGVTPQAVIAAAKPAFAITHAPGSMLITDKRNSQLSAF
jgi:uncharacterized protein YcsI (UPF0317 family)